MKWFYVTNFHENWQEQMRTALRHKNAFILLSNIDKEVIILIIRSTHKLYDGEPSDLVGD